jgi:predicted nuclease of predicted toxin-antitoxin system
VKLLLDEMYAATVAEQLRARGHDVVSVHDPDFRQLEGAPDEDVFASAIAEGRALVTENAPDFRRLEAEALARGESTPGLVFTTNQQFPRGHPGTIGQLIHALAALLAEQPAVTTATFLKAPPSS